MAKRPRRNHSAAFKAKVAVEALKGTDRPSQNCRAIPSASEPDHGMEETASGEGRRSIRQGKQAATGPDIKEAACQDRNSWRWRTIFIKSRSGA